MNAAKDSGFELFEDSNGYKQEGFGTFDVTIHDGKRYGAGKAYLDDVKNNSNIEIFTHSNVSKILFKDKVAMGVEVLINNKKEKYYANKEILLSAGSINSPKLTSIIRNRKCHRNQRRHGIDVIHDLPGVGENLQDHLGNIYST